MLRMSKIFREIKVALMSEEEKRKLKRQKRLDKLNSPIKYWFKTFFDMYDI